MYRFVPRVCLPVLLIACVGCATYRPVPMDQVPFLERAQTKHDGEVSVTVAVLTAKESEKIFGRPLANMGIQPVWLKIENNDDVPYMLVSRDLDPNYFSASEAAYINRLSFNAKANDEMADDFREKLIEPIVRPDSETSGFVYTNLDAGTKVVAVTLFGPKRLKDLVFFVAVPGLQADHHRVDFKSIYAPEEIVDFDDKTSFREMLSQFQCCTRNKEDTKDGDPLNLVLIGEGDVVYAAFALAGWDETEVLNVSTAMKTAKSALKSSKYRYAPISPQYVFGRDQDIALQKARETIHQRNHLRVWRAPWRYKGEDVWIGQISRDIGVRFTTGAWYLSTHAIDPDVDEARDYLLQDIAASQRLDRFGFTEGVGEATPEAPREILLGDPYWTDGLRLVMHFTAEPTAMDEIDFYYWDWYWD